MRITKHVVYKVGDSIFETPENAIDHVEGELFASYKKALIANGFTANEAFKAYTTLLTMQTEVNQAFTCLANFKQNKHCDE